MDLVFIVLLLFLSMIFPLITLRNTCTHSLQFVITILSANKCCQMMLQQPGTAAEAEGPKVFFCILADRAIGLIGVLFACNHHA